MDLLNANETGPILPPAPAWWLSEPSHSAEDRKGPALPKQLSASCAACGCPMHWQDLAGNLHCCQCVLIPSRSMADSAWLSTANGWEPYQPARWNPYQHLDAIADANHQKEVDGF